MLELLHLSAQVNLTLIDVLFITQIAFGFMAFMGVMVLDPTLTLHNGGVSVAVFGILMVVSGLVGAGVAGGEQQLLKNERPYESVPGYTFNTSEYQPIVSLSDGQTYGMSGRGSFFLGIGSVYVDGKTVPQYVFYKNLSEGYQLGTIPAEDVTIREDADKDGARIEWLYQHTVSEKITYTDNNETWGGKDTVTLIRKYIHVPPGTVIREYRLDSRLEK